jgi:predicted glycosyltransferase
MSARILFHVQHLLGIGHVRRAAALAAALADAGFDVTLVSGGMPVTNLVLGKARLAQLPPVRAADVTFKTLVDESNRPIDEAWRTKRRATLLDLFAATRPQVLITELFPFGRRMLEFELMPLLDAAHTMVPRPLVLASLRDILAAASSPAKGAKTIERVRRYYDHLLVHGDPAFLPLEASFPEAREVADRVAYTGYVQGPTGPTPPPGEGDGEILVSVGGGAVGARLLAAAIEARRLSREATRTWRLLGGQPAADGAPKHATDGLILERARPDFPGLLARCHVSVSQAGYNTVMDVLTTRARTVVVPFAQANETEQTQRAEALAARGWAQIVAEAELTPALLAAAIDRAAAGPPPAPGSLRADGAAETARLVGRWLSHR